MKVKYCIELIEEHDKVNFYSIHLEERISRNLKISLRSSLLGAILMMRLMSLSLG